MEARQHLLAHVVVVTQWTPTLAYNAVAISRDRVGLQRRGRLSQPRRFTTRRTTSPSTPADPSVVRANQVLSLVYILSGHFNSSKHHYTALLVFLYTGKIIVILRV